MKCHGLSAAMKTPRCSFYLRLLIHNIFRNILPWWKFLHHNLFQSHSHKNTARGNCEDEIDRNWNAEQYSLDWIQIIEKRCEWDWSHFCKLNIFILGCNEIYITILFSLYVIILGNNVVSTRKVKTFILPKAYLANAWRNNGKSQKIFRVFLISWFIISMLWKSCIPIYIYKPAQQSWKTLYWLTCAQAVTLWIHSWNVGNECFMEILYSY